MPETGFRRQDVAARTRLRQLFDEGRIAARRPGLRVLLIAAVTAGFASEAVDRLAVARLDQVGLQDSIGPALLVGGATVAQAFVALLVLAAWGPRLAGVNLVAAMVVLHATTAAGTIVLAGAGGLWAALSGMIAADTARSVARTVSIGWTNHFTHRHNRATVHSFVGQAQSFGEISGGIALGVLASEVGIGAALTTAAVIYLATSVWSTRGRRVWARPA